MISSQWFREKALRIGKNCTKLLINPLKIGVAP